MNERSTHLNAFIYNSTPIRIVSQRYRTFLISSTTSSSSLVVDLAAFVLVPFIVVSLRRSLLTSHASYVVRSSHHFPSANRTSPIPGLIVSPHRRLHFILRPLSPSSSLSLAPLRRRLINLSAFVVLVIVVSESSQAAFVVSARPASNDTCPSLSRSRIVTAFIVETRAFVSTCFVVHDCVAVSPRERHAAGFGGAADATRRRSLPAASSSPLSASPKGNLYRRLSTIASSRVSAKLRNTKDNAWPVAS